MLTQASSFHLNCRLRAEYLGFLHAMHVFDSRCLLSGCLRFVQLHEVKAKHVVKQPELELHDLMHLFDAGCSLSSWVTLQLTQRV